MIYYVMLFLFFSFLLSCVAYINVDGLNIGPNTIWNLDSKTDLPADISYDIISSNGPIDIIVMNTVEFPNYKNKLYYRYYEKLSKYDITHVILELQDGEFSSNSITVVLVNRNMDESTNVKINVNIGKHIEPKTLTENIIAVMFVIIMLGGLVYMGINDIPV